MFHIKVVIILNRALKDFFSLLNVNNVMLKATFHRRKRKGERKTEKEKKKEKKIDRKDIIKTKLMFYYISN